MILKPAFQIEKLMFLYAIITNPSHSEKDKQINTCIEWIASLRRELKKKKTGNILVTENKPRDLRWKRFAPLPVQASLWQRSSS